MVKKLVADPRGGRVTRVLATLALTAILLIPAADLGTVSCAKPGAVVNYPPDGSIVNTTQVTVAGTATGTGTNWTQTSYADFTAGQVHDLHLNLEGSLALNLTIYDNFNTHELDYGKWDYVSANNINFYKLDPDYFEVSGTGSPPTRWNAFAIAYSKQPFPSAISAVMVDFYAVGTGSRSFIGLYQDDQNQVWAGMARDCEISNNQTIAWWGYMSGGSRSDFNLGQYGGNFRTFAVTYSGGVASVFIEGSKRGETAISLSNTKGIIGGRVREYNDIVSVYWDNASTGDHMVTSGTYLSPVCDTHASAPVLKKAEWASNEPYGTGVTVQVRSSENADMTAAGPWTDVENGQADGFPAAKRFIQYRAILNSPDGAVSPVFNQMKLSYYLPVSSVELSTDDQSTWVSAVGQEQWQARLTLPDNTTRLWTRVTDISGAVDVSSISLKVDTQPPTGTITLNGGAKYTADRKAAVTFAVTDNTGIKSYMLSESPDFWDALWMPYQPSAEFTLSMGDGLKTVHARFRDLAGWESAPMNCSIFLYTGLPTGSLLIDQGASYTPDPYVTLTFETGDPVGIGEMMISNKADFQGAAWTPYKQETQWDLLPGNGLRTVYSRVRNLVGTASKVFNDSIILDTVSPAVKFVINGGSAYTNSVTVSLSLNATDNYQVGSVKASEDRYFVCSTWEPFAPVMAFNLSSGEGTKTIFCRVMDGAGNIGPADSASIVLDLSAPAAFVQKLPSSVSSVSLKVMWSGTDQLSGIRSFDVQYRDGTGPWTDWLAATTAFSGNFTGEYGHRYYFRVRGRDGAGNAGAYPDELAGPVSFEPPLPRVVISNLAANATISGTFVLKGTASHPRAGMAVLQVEVKLDAGEWKKAKGTSDWSCPIDTTKLSNGPHTLRVRAFDGTWYSTDATVEFRVKNAAAPVGTGQLVVPVIIGIVLAVAAGSAYLVMRRRKSPGPAPAAPSAEESVPASATEPSPPAPVPIAARDEASAATFVGGEPGAGEPPITFQAWNQPAGEPRAEGIETVTMVRTVDEGAEREKRILKGLSSLPRGLPSSLAGMDLSELVEKVARAEQRTGPDGETLVKVAKRWYYGDEKDPSTFLQECKKL
jgi:hypothetical protein